MSRSDFAKETGAKLKKIRNENHLTMNDMAAKLNLNRGTYSRNENGLTIPSYFTLYRLGNDFEISLDWFVLDKAPMYFGEEEEETMSPLPLPLPHAADINELLDHMEKIPLLRYEILAQFHRFKEEHPSLVQNSMTNKAAN